MYIELLSNLKNSRLEKWKKLLQSEGLSCDEKISHTVLIWDENELAAAGSGYENILKCIAVNKSYQGLGLTAKVITELRKEAFGKCYNHLFLYTKPSNEEKFSSLFFYPVAHTDKILLMENRANGIADFVNKLPHVSGCRKNGAIIMNCNPFTLGHRFLIETASRECEQLFVFVVSEDKSYFSFNDRIEMVIRGTCDLDNVTVLSTGPYLISSATFPTYFLKNRDDSEEIHCLLDIEIFAQYFAPKLSVTERYIGTELLSPLTDKYNGKLKEILPEKGINVKEIQRIEKNNQPISASYVRKLIEKKDISSLRDYIPDSTFDYLKEKGLI